jgi:hypothetical protein
MAEFLPSISFDSPLAQPIDEAAPKVEPPAHTADGEEYICGNTGNAHPYANPGRDQDRSRVDETIPAQAFARYVS